MTEFMVGRTRFPSIAPRDVPGEIAARRLGQSLAEFNAIKPNLLARGFPQPDPDTGNYDLDAINRWCDARHPHLFGAGATMQARDARLVVSDRLKKLTK
jgi:hypothetical protein